ncbi:ROK family protein [Listeria fleischmannii 1991]|uniref:Beta-glucoside kinase n=2 Tax=Listeria fleischmannii TaxID=1069827 RepID=A0A2X3HDN7_9LIST|nr:ROK family protein [Listeria fleischmannii]EMG27126.1 ROK family protein [Listeria fleischmannii subsp. fleischmannii LU2006-1]KMT59986.1 ROK family protein [Listeria fleischmannii 1991]SQC70667.1 Beta-glucoside kinase [Listeria fleischmannii subsp. fleischmannii]
MILAFDIGGTALKMGVVSEDGNLIDTDTVAISKSDGRQILQKIESFHTKWIDAKGIAISAPGYVNPETGLITMGGAIREFDNFNIKTHLENKTGKPVSVENDANCVALAEKWLGKAQHLDHFLCLTIGTGIGGGIFANGELIRGGKFRAGEFGYMFAYRPSSGRVPAATLNETTTMLTLRKNYARTLNIPLSDITGELIFEKYDAGDPLSTRLVHEFFNGICMGLYNLIYLFDPTHIFIGGGITSRPSFLEELRGQMEWFGLRDTIIDTASYKNSAGLLGATYHYLCQNEK